MTPKAIYGFSQTFLFSRYNSPKPTPEFHFKLWEYCCDPHPQVAIAAPRGHAKTTAVSLAYVLANVLFRERKFVIIISDTEKQAIKFLGNIKSELMGNEDLKKVFKIKEFEKYTETEIIVIFEDGAKFCIMAQGSQQPGRGWLWENMRPDLIVGDDLENDECVLNGDRREKFRDWFYNAVLPSLSDEGIVRIVGTILHMDSLLERLMPKKEIVSEELYDYSKAESSWKAIRFRAHNTDFSEILWPEKFSKKRLEARRQDYVEQGNPSGYAQEYLNYPIDEQTAYFRRADLTSIKDNSENLNYYIGTDFAVSEKAKRDWSAFVVCGVSPTGMLKVVHVIRERMDAFGIAEEFVNLQKRFSPEMFIVEKGTIWSALSPVIHKHLWENKVFPIIHEMPVTADKMARASSIQARMRMGGVEIDKDAPWYPGFESELIRFPKDTHDDQVDALSWVGLVLKNVFEAQTPEEIEEEEWESEYNEAYGDQGMSTWCGY